MQQALRRLRILALTHCPPDEPCTFARIYTPLHALEAAGKVEYALEPIWPWRAAAFRRILQDLPNWDVIWAARPRHYLMLPLMHEAKRLGIPVLVDIDDWLLERPDSFDAQEWCGTQTSRQTMRQALLMADAVTASTSVIAARCAGLGIQARVIPNAIDCNLFTRQPRHTDSITVAFCGTIAHRDDVPLIAPGLRQLLHTHGDHLRVVTVGCPIPELQGVEGYTHCGFVAATAYPRLLSALGIDIGLAPLYDTSFNRARSDIKYLEYSATGAATIASPSEAYSHSIRSDRGILVPTNTTEAWAASIRRLVEDASLRQRVSRNACNWVRSERSIDATAHRWYDAFYDHARKARANASLATPGKVAPGTARRRYVLKHVVVRQVPYYGRELPPLLLRKAFRELHGRARSLPFVYRDAR